MRVPWSAAAAVLASFAGPGAADPAVLDDFEAPEPAREWTAWGASVRRVPAGAGGALEVAGWRPDRERGTILERRFLPMDLARFESLAFTAARTGGPLDTVVDLRAGDGPRLLRGRVRVEDGTREVVLPLRYFDPESFGLLGSTGGVDRVQFRWAAPSGTLVLDDIRLIPGKRGEGSARMSAEDWAALGLGYGRAKAIPGRSFVLLTDRKEFQGPKGARVLASLEEVVPALADRFALKPVPGERAPFFLVGDDQVLGDLYLTLGKSIAGDVRTLPRGSGSFARLGAAGCCLGADGQVYEPIAQHQALHLVVARSLRFGTGGDWIQESLVSSVGRRLAPEYFDLPGIPWRRVSAESFRLALAGQASNLLPLATLLSPGGDRPENYIEFASVGDFLSSRHRARLPAAWEALRAMDRPPAEAGLEVLCGALGTTPAEFEADWLKWGAANFK